MDMKKILQLTEGESKTDAICMILSNRVTHWVQSCLPTIFASLTFMLIRKGYKFRLEPSTVQRADMVMFAGHNRAVWNKALALTKDKLERKQPMMWFHELNWNMVNFWKKSEEMFVIETTNGVERFTEDEITEALMKQHPERFV